MSIEIENLTDAIVALTEKLNGIGIEIYHLNSTIETLGHRVKDLASKEPWNE